MALATGAAIAAAVAVGAAIERGESHAQRRPTSPPRTTAPAATRPAPPASLTVLTYNAGLAVGILPLARERVPLVNDALAREPADVVCAQEVWLDEHWRGLASRVAGRLPHLHRASLAPRAADEACSAADIAPLEACHRASCARARPDDLASCMIGRCAHLVGSIGAGCVSCLLREPWSSIGAVRAACAADLPPIARPTAARTAAPTFAFGGSSGIGLLSRLPLTDTDTLPLRSSWSRREVLYARIPSSDVGPLHVFCTHLSAQLGAVTPSGGKTWAQEHAEQVTDLLRFVERKTAGVPGAVVLAGDLNTGPALAGVRGQLPLHYARLETAGFDNPYAAQADARCTYCFDNPLVGARPGGLLIDHVLLRGFTGATGARRVLDRPVPLAGDGSPRTTPPSDHYGVSVTLSASSPVGSAPPGGASPR